ncbi:hypothetical protein ABXS75_10305 [Roseburia hominis]
MLAKLIKHDMRSMSKLLILMHIPALLLTVAVKYAGVLRLYALEKPEPIAILTICIAVVYLSVTSFFTQLYTAVYSYRKLFSREGYLTLTLPVKASTQVLAKFLSGSFWILLNMLILFGAAFYIIRTPQLLQDIRTVFANEFGPHFLQDYISFVAILFVGSIVSCFSNMAIALGCLSFGHCFRKHRVLLAIVGYAGISMLIQIITFGVQAFTTFGNPRFYEDTLSASDFLALYRPLLYVTLVTSIVLGITCYLFSCYVMKRRLNLD